MKKNNGAVVLAHTVFILFGLCCLIPMIYLVSSSISNEQDLFVYGYRLIPKSIDFSAYKYLLHNPAQMLSAYKVTIFITVAGTFLALLVMIMIAYPLSVRDFKFKRQLSFYLFFTMLFSGGLVAVYLLNVQYLHLKNNILVYILPALVSPWYVFMLRSFFAGIPQSLRESAKIDGASEFKILFQIIVPISKPAIATIAFMELMIKWGEWYNCMLYITKPGLQTVQYLLQALMQQSEKLAQAAEVGVNAGDIPTETVKLAMAVIAAGPIMFIFPFFQKYFVKGMTVGSVKG